MDAKRDAEFEAEVSLFEDHNADIPDPILSARESLNHSTVEIRWGGRPLHVLTWVTPLLGFSFGIIAITLSP
jgi:hypothetical protein